MSTGADPAVAAPGSRPRRRRLKLLPGHGPPRSVHLGERFRSGEQCRANGVYRFDGYVHEPTPTPLPLLRHRIVHLRRGERFPTFALYKEDAYWKLEAFTASGRTEEGDPRR